jgi:hypothetical protein
MSNSAMSVMEDLYAELNDTECNIIVHGRFTFVHFGQVVDAIKAKLSVCVCTDNVDSAEEVLGIWGVTAERGFKVTVRRLATEEEIEAHEASCS